MHTSPLKNKLDNDLWRTVFRKSTDIEHGVFIFCKGLTSNTNIYWVVNQTTGQSIGRQIATKLSEYAFTKEN